MKAIVGFTCVLILACFPLRAFAQGAGSVMQGAGSAAAGAAQQAGTNAAGQVMQSMGMMSPSPAASPASNRVRCRPERHQPPGCRPRHHQPLS